MLPTPIINKISVFNANEDYTFTFTYMGVQVVKNELVIRDNITDEIVYQKIIKSMRLSHTVNAVDSCLENGKTYNVQVRVMDEYWNSEEDVDHISNYSEKKVFSCQSEPLLCFSNIKDTEQGTTVNMLNVTCYLSLEQAGQDKLKSFKYYLYDADKRLVSSSSTFYSTENMTYTYYELEDKSTYYIRATGETLYGFYVDTGYVKINTYNTMHDSNMDFLAINENGTIKIIADIESTDYKLKNEYYSLSGGWLMLGDNSITYRVRDFDDFSVILNAKQVPLGKKFFEIKNDNGINYVNLSMLDINGDAYCKLTAKVKNTDYVLYKKISTVEEYLNLSNYVIELHRKDAAYSLFIYNNL